MTTHFSEWPEKEAAQRAVFSQRGQQVERMRWKKKRGGREEEAWWKRRGREIPNFTFLRKTWTQAAAQIRLAVGG